MKTKQKYPSQFKTWKVFVHIVQKLLNAEPGARIELAESIAKQHLNPYSDLWRRVANTALRMVAWIETHG